MVAVSPVTPERPGRPSPPRAGQHWLQLFGQGEWEAAKHGRARLQWRKLHLAVDAGSGGIAAHVLTDGNADDAAQTPALLRQVEGPIASVTAAGPYDGEPLYRSAAARQHDPSPDVVIPRATAVPSTDDFDLQTTRDRHIQLIAERSRTGWQRATGYGRRNHVETAIGRYKRLIGPKLSARTLIAQLGEAAIDMAALNRMASVTKSRSPFIGAEPPASMVTFGLCPARATAPFQIASLCSSALISASVRLGLAVTSSRSRVSGPRRPSNSRWALPVSRTQRIRLIAADALSSKRRSKRSLHHSHQPTA